MQVRIKKGNEKGKSEPIEKVKYCKDIKGTLRNTGKKVQDKGLRIRVFKGYKNSGVQKNIYFLNMVDNRKNSGCVM